MLFKRFLSLLLAVVMVFSMMPTTGVFASENDSSDTLNPSISADSNVDGDLDDETDVSDNTEPTVAVETTTPETVVPEEIIASGDCGDNLTWELSSNGTLTVTGSGEMEVFGYGEAPWYEYREQILNVVIGDGVTYIGDYAFIHCENMIQVQLPEGLTEVGNNAFQFCYSLVSLDLPSSLTHFGYEAFSYCTGLTEVEIPEGTTGIGGYTFGNCDSLTSVTLPESLKQITLGAFYECTSLETIVIPEGVYYLGIVLFSGCISLKEITLPSTLEGIDNNAFENCSSLTDVYYTGTRSQWNNVGIESGNEPLTNATLHCAAPEVDGPIVELDVEYTPEIAGQSYYTYYFIPEVSGFYLTSEAYFDCDYCEELDCHHFQVEVLSDGSTMNYKEEYYSEQNEFCRAYYMVAGEIYEIHVLNVDGHTLTGYFMLSQCAMSWNNADATVVDTLAYNGHYYVIFTSSYNWVDARDYCDYLGGHLVTITSAAEQDAVAGLNSNQYHLWAGGRLASDGNWRWVTSEPWGYTNWNEGEPSNSHTTGENCLVLSPALWNDLYEVTTEKSGFVCEWDNVYDVPDELLSSLSLELNQVYSQNLTVEETVYFTFTPEEDGLYIVNVNGLSIGSWITDGPCTVYDSAWTEDGGVFYRYYLYGGNTYSVALCNYHGVEQDVTLEVRQAEEPSAVTLPETLTVYAGNTYPLKLDFGSYWAFTNDIRWTLEGDAVSFVNDPSYTAVIIRGDAVGTATVTVTYDGGKTTSCLITVEEAPMLSLGQTTEITVGANGNLVLELTPEVSGIYSIVLGEDSELGTEMYKVVDGGTHYLPRQYGYAYLEAGCTYKLYVYNYQSYDQYTEVLVDVQNALVMDGDSIGQAEYVDYYVLTAEEAGWYAVLGDYECSVNFYEFDADQNGWYSIGDTFGHYSEELDRYISGRTVWLDGGEQYLVRVCNYYYETTAMAVSALTCPTPTEIHVWPDYDVAAVGTQVYCNIEFDPGYARDAYTVEILSGSAEVPHQNSRSFYIQGTEAGLVEVKVTFDCGLECTFTITMVDPMEVEEDTAASTTIGGYDRGYFRLNIAENGYYILRVNSVNCHVSGMGGSYNSYGRYVDYENGYTYFRYQLWAENPAVVYVYNSNSVETDVEVLLRPAEVPTELQISGIQLALSGRGQSYIAVFDSPWAYAPVSWECTGDAFINGYTNLGPWIYFQQEGSATVTATVSDLGLTTTMEITIVDYIELFLGQEQEILLPANTEMWYEIYPEESGLYEISFGDATNIHWYLNRIDENGNGYYVSSYDGKYLLSAGNCYKLYVSNNNGFDYTATVLIDVAELETLTVGSDPLVTSEENSLYGLTVEESGWYMVRAEFLDYYDGDCEIFRIAQGWQGIGEGSTYWGDPNYRYRIAWMEAGETYLLQIYNYSYTELTVSLEECPEPTQFHAYANNFQTAVGMRVHCYLNFQPFNGRDAYTVEVTAGDAQIVDQQGTYFYVLGNSAGEVEVTVTLENGLSDSFTIEFVEPTELPEDTELIANVAGYTYGYFSPTVTESGYYVIGVNSTEIDRSCSGAYGYYGLIVDEEDGWTYYRMYLYANEPMMLSLYNRNSEEQELCIYMQQAQTPETLSIVGPDGLEAGQTGYYTLDFGSPWAFSQVYWYYSGDGQSWGSSLDRYVRIYSDEYTLTATTEDGSLSASLQIALQLPEIHGELQLHEYSYYDMEYAGDYVYYSFTAPEAGDYFFAVMGDNDVYLELYNDSWSQIGYNDDYYNLHSGLWYYLEEGQTVYVKARPLSESNYCLLTTVVSTSTDVYDGEICHHEYEQEVIEPECDYDGYTLHTCIYCGDWYEDDYVAALGHDYVAVNTYDPTCQEYGYTEYECSRCGDWYDDDYVDPVDHEYVDGYCSVCGTEDFAVLQELVLNESVVVEIPTSGTRVRFRFTPTVTERYAFFSTGNQDTKCWLYDSNGNQLTYNDDYLNSQFHLFYVLTAGETYIFEAGYYGDYYSGTYEATLVTAHSFIEGVCEYCEEPLYITGTCGENLTWTLDSTYTLTISGTGLMYNYGYYGGSLASTLEEGDLVIEAGDAEGSVDVEEGDVGETDTEITVDGYAPWYEYREMIQSVIIEDGVTSVGAGAFADMYYLTEVQMGADVTRIGDYAFQSCNNLQTVQLPDLVTSIGMYAFAHCEQLESFQIPANLTYISMGMLSGCMGLTEIEIPENVTAIGSEAFWNCSGLSQIVIPDTVTEIGEYALAYCSNLTSVELPDGLTEISYGLLYGCCSLESLVIPENVTVINSQAFWDCSGLSQIVIPDAVTEIGDYAFAGCSNLTSVQIPAAVTQIGGYAFRYCTALSTITFLGDAPSFGSYTFYGLTANCRYPADNETWTQDVKQSYGGDITWVSYGENGDVVDQMPSMPLDTPVSVTISTGGNRVRYQFTPETTDRYIITSTSSYDTYCYLYDSNGNQLAYNDDGNGNRQFRLEYVMTAGELYYIEYKFYSSSTTGSMEVTMTLQHDYVDGICTNCGEGLDLSGDCGENVQWTLIEGVLTISGEGDMTAYTSDYYVPWYNYRHLVTSIIVEEGVTSVGDYAFYGCSNAMSVTLGNTLTSIGYYAFYNCDGLQSVVIPENVETIEAYAFYECSNLIQAQFNGSAAAIYDYVFYVCSNLERVVFLADVPTINSYAFHSVTAYAIYPAGNETWTAAAMQNYGGFLRWAYEDEDGNLVEAALVLNPGEAHTVQIDTAYTGTMLRYVAEATDLYKFYINNSQYCYAMLYNSEGEQLWSGNGYQYTLEYVLEEGETYYIYTGFNYGYTGSYEVTLEQYHSYVDGYCSHCGLALNITGTCGDYLNWSITGNYVLTISGTGEMYDYTGSDSPWYLYKDMITVIVVEDGVTSVGNYAFYDCYNVTSVDLGATVSAIGEYAFYYIYNSIELIIPSSVTTIGQYAFGYWNGLDRIVFQGDAPAISGYAFYGVNAVAVYPAGNETWTDDLKLRYGGMLIWKSLDENGVETDDAPSIALDTLTEIQINNSGDRVLLSFTPEVNDLYRIYSIGTLDTTCYLYDATGNQLAYNDDGYGNGQFLIAYYLEAGKTYYFYPGRYGSGTGTFNVMLEQRHQYTDGFCANCGHELYITGTCGDALTWTLDSSYTLTVSGNGAMYGYGSSSWSADSAFESTDDLISGYAPWYEWRDYITTVVIEDGVTSIGHAAFAHCYNITSVTLGSDITTIGSMAFYDCYNIQSVNVPLGVTHIGQYAFYNCYGITTLVMDDTMITEESTLVHIGSYAFYNCDGLTMAVIPGSVTAIGDYAFYDCDSLTTVAIGDGVTGIGRCAFYRCDNLATVTMGEGVEEIGYYAFGYCYSLRQINLPTTLITIGDQAFYYCSALTQVDLYDGLTSIGYNAFGYCTTLESLVIPDSVTYVGNYAFAYCQNLTSLTLPENLEEIPYGMCYRCYSLGQIVIPQYVTVIRGEAFFECSALTEITIPDSVTAIENYAFGYCSALTEFTFPTLVEEVSYGVLYYCVNLEQVTLPLGLTAIRGYAFYGCESLLSVEIPDTVTTIDSYAFQDCTSLEEVTLSESLTYIGSYAFAECTALTQIQIPDTVTSLGEYAFYNCDRLTEFTFPAGITSISESVLFDCMCLTTVTIPYGVTSIGRYAFRNCPALTEVVIPDSVTHIYADAFLSCTSLTSLHIPSSVTYIGRSAFASCTNLQHVVLAPIAVPSLGSSVFYNTSALQTITVPLVSYDAYVSALSGYVSEDVEIIGSLDISTLKNLRASLISSATVVLAWEAMPGITVDYYEISRDGVVIGTTTDCTYTDTGLEAGVEYAYTVQAISASGAVSALTELNVTTTLPEVLNVSTGYVGNILDDLRSDIYVTVANGEYLGSLGETDTTLRLELVNGDETILIGETVCVAGSEVYTFAMDLSLVEDGTYNLLATLTDVDGASTTYSEELVVDRDYPEQIVGVSAFGDVRYIYINWGISAEVDTETYRIYRRASDESDFRLIREVQGRNCLAYTDTDVVLGLTYEYYIIGVDNLGREGEASDVVSAAVEPDTTAPNVTKLYPANGSYLSGNEWLEITAQDDLQATSAAFYYSLDGGETWELLLQLEEGRFGGYVDTTQFADGVIRIKGVAWDAAGNESSGLTYVYSIDNTGPSQVQNVTFEATNVTATLRWDNVSDEDISYFCVEQKNADGAYVVYRYVYSTLGLNIYNLAPETSYTYRVVGYDSQGNRGIPSEDIVVTTGSDTTPPVITSLRPGAGYYNNTIHLSATATDEYFVSSITLQISTDLINWTDVYSRTFTDVSSYRTLSYILDLSEYAEGAIYFRAVCTDAAGNQSDASVNAGYVQYIIDRQAPAIPENVVAAGGNGYIMVSWTQGSEADLSSYALYRAESVDGEYTLIAGGLRVLNYYDRSVEEGQTYYYKLVATDVAGNNSEMSDAASATVAEDTEAPVIHSIYPVTGTVIGTSNSQVSISVSDNRSLGHILIEYSLDGEEYTTLYELDYVASYGQYAGAELPIDGLEHGAVIYVRASAADRADNWSEYLYAQYTVDNTAPTVTGANVSYDEQNNWVTVTWNGNDEEDLVRYAIYRKTNNGSYGLVNYVYPVAGQTAYTYNDTYLDSASVTYTYKIVAVDACGNQSAQLSDDVDTPEITTPEIVLPDRTAPTPVIRTDADMEVGVEYLFDATASWDNTGIIEYLWDFGDGTTGSGTNVIHIYGEVGTYTVTLTVKDHQGNPSSTTRQVVVSERSQLGVVTIRVVDENGNVVPGASVYFDLGEDNQVIKVTDSSGRATFTTKVGVHTVGCFISNNEWLPATKDVVVTAGSNTVSTITIVHQTMIEGYFEVNRMTFEEIVAAGIDVSAPENQHIVRINVTLVYGTSANSTETSFMFNMSTGSTIGEVARITYSTGGGIGGGGSGGGSGGGGGSRELIPAIFVNGTSEEDIAIAYLDIPIGASFLKEFFDVKLHILNNASSEFKMVDNVINLNLPDGLTLMETDNSCSTEIVLIDEIAGQSSETINWIIRGDKAGSYQLSADYTGTLAVFDEQVSTTFVSDEPLVVYGLDAIKLTMEINSTMYYDGFYFNLTMENVSDIDVYMPSLEVIGNTISTYLDYLSEDMEDVYSEPEVHLLNTLLTSAGGYTQYIGTDTTVTTLAPGESITEKYAVYNAVGYNNMMYLKSAAYTIEEGMGVDFEIIVTDFDLYNTVNALEKIEDIRSNFEKDRMYRFLMGHYNYFYIQESLDRDSDFWTVYGEALYGVGKSIFSFDFDYNDEQTREITRKLVAQLLLDEAAQDAVAANIDTKYLDMTEKLLKAVAGFLPDDESTNLLQEYMENSDNMAELAKTLQIKGLDGFYGRLGTVVGSTVISSVLTSYSTELDDAFHGALGEACSKIGDVVEGAGKVVTAWKDATEMTAALVNIAAAQEEAKDLLDMLAANVDQDTPIYDEIIDIQQSMENVQNEMSKQFLSELTEEIVGKVAEEAATALLKSCFGAAAGPLGTIYAVLKIAFGTLDYIFDWSGDIEDLHVLRVNTSLSFALTSAVNEYGLYPETRNQALYTLKALKYVIKMRLIGEQAYIEMAKSDDKAEEYLAHVRTETGVNYEDLDAYGSDIFAKILSYRDQMFATYYTDLDLPEAPEVSINYLTSTTNEAFSSDYEYSFDGSTWYVCDGNVITLNPGKVGCTLRVRVRSTETTLAGNLATITIPAKPVLFGDISVVYVGHSHRITGLKAGTYTYQFTNDKTLETLTGTLTVEEDDQLVVLPENGVWTYMAISSVETETQFASQIRYLVTEEKDVSQLIIDKDSVQILEGDTEQLTVQVLPEDALNQTLTWTSSNPNVATVDENGLITAILEGSAIITATTNDGTNIQVQCVVNVLHRHIYDAVVTDPDCTNDGYTTHTCRCGDSYIDSYVDALGHDYGEWYVTVDVTCTTDGEERHDCSRCEHYETRVVEMLGHDLIHHEALAPTCTEIGWHEYDTCSRCDYTTYVEIPATGHTYESVVTDPTCTEQGYTTHTCHCGDSYIDSYVDALGHDYGEWYVTVPVQCLTDGEERHDCSRCDHYETRAVEKLGHDLVHHDAVAPTCTEIGWYEYDTCSRCDYTTYVEIPATGHTYESVVTDPTCTEQGYTTHTCHCGDSYIDSYVDALGHDYGEWYVTVEVTCTTDGEERHDCSRCDHYETRVVEKLGHDLVHHDGQSATCTEIGWDAYDTCSRCDYTTYVEIPATGHSHVAVVTDPTCTEQGYTTHTCNCGDSYIDSYVDALGHDYGEWYVTVPVQCLTDGEERHDCTRCEHYETRVVEKLGHDLVHHDAVDPTCTEIGWDAYDTCSRCDYTTYVEIPATGHSYVAVVTDPTCTEQGYTTHTCHCGDSYIDSYVDALGHDYGEWYVTVDVTCTTDGEERHDCSRCDHYETRVVEKLGHDLVHHDGQSATCTEIGWDAYDTCSRCDYTTYVEIPAHGHDYGVWYVTVAATCTTDGEERHDCSRCEHYETRVVEMLGHDYGEWYVTVEATCTTDGEERHDCTRCDHYETRVVEKLGHDLIHHEALDPTCTEIGWDAYDTCSRCDYTTYVEIPATGHSHVAVVTDPTCTEQGYTTHTCHCGDSYIDSYVDALGHDLVHYEAQDPNCTAHGWHEHDACSRCDYTTYVEIPATGHAYESVVTDPTCTEQGYTTYTCTVCGYIYIDNYVEALGHDYGEWYVTVEATCTTDGEERHDCSRCEHYETRVVEKLGHDLIHHDAVAPTCTEIGWDAYDTCSRCDYTTYVEIPATGHTYESVVTAPTYTEQGYTTHTCTVCGDSYVDSYTDCLIRDGWIKENDQWYYYVDGVMQTGWKQIGSKWYYMDIEGVMQTGWLKDGGKWYYLSSSGAMVTGWMQINSKWYYFTSSGAMQTGWLESGGTWYYLNSDGAMVTGWRQINSKWYYFESSGAMQSGWLEDNGKWYYLDNAMVTGWKQINSKWYYFDSTGAMQSGWLKDGGKWYYLDNTMVTGWKLINSKWYYFASDGAMQTGWVKIDNTWYYMNSSGAMQTGWLKDGGNWYYLKSNGAMATGTLTIDGKVYYFNNNGVWIP